MIPSKMQIPVVPLTLMPAHTWTFTGCLVLYQESRINCHCIIQNVTGREQVSEKYSATRYVFTSKPACMYLHVMYKAYTCMYMYNSCKQYTYVVNKRINILHVLYQERIKRYEYQKVQFM